MKSASTDKFRALMMVSRLIIVSALLLPSAAAESEFTVAASPQNRVLSTSSCGEPPAPLSQQRNVLLIGDSISMAVPYTPGGYGKNARAILGNHSVNVWHGGGWRAGGQASNTVKGLECTDPSIPSNYLNITEGQYDIVHFNYGLHDLSSYEFVNQTSYAENLAEIYTRLLSKAKAVIWATTTPCPAGTSAYNRTDSKVQSYNLAAADALKKAAAAAGRKLLVDDLYAAVIRHCGHGYVTCDLQKHGNVHFLPKGQEFLGEAVAASVLAALGDL